MALLAAADRVRRSLAEPLAAQGITLAQYSVLLVLRAAGPDGLPTLEAGRQLIEHAPGITRMMDRLESRGWVTRRRGHGDRRQVLCALTVDGQDLVDRLAEPVADAMRLGLGRLDSAQQRELLTLLTAI
jgi:DNA-binding MarR family transcriptional regulator